MDIVSSIFVFALVLFLVWGMLFVFAVCIMKAKDDDERSDRG
jgi:hypothetical protein